MALMFVSVYKGYYTKNILERRLMMEKTKRHKVKVALVYLCLAAVLGGLAFSSWSHRNETRSGFDTKMSRSE